MDSCLVSRSGITVVRLKDDESKCKEALRERLVMFFFNPPLSGFHWHGVGRKPFCSRRLKICCCCILFRGWKRLSVYFC